jgi:hypothetical protein
MNHMARLRKAAPAAPLPAIDRDLLFNRIVAQPGDPGVAAHTRRPRSAPRKLTIALIAFALAAMTAGTAVATGFLGWHDEAAIVKSPHGWQALYRAATRQLTLPPGETWPHRTLPPNSVTGKSQPGGEAVAISQNRWECYWAHAIQTGNTAAQKQAQAALADIVAHHILVAPAGSSENVAPPSNLKGPFAIFADDGGLQFVKQMYADAAAGRPAMLIQSCRANS